MRVEELSFSDPQRNLEHDDELLALAEKGLGQEVLRFWESSSLFVVLGRTGREDMDVDASACRKDGIPVLRRSSGGGTVLQGPGCLNFSLVLDKVRHPDLQSITCSYEHILSKVIKALRVSGVETEFRPVCDLVLMPDAKKFSGNAQRRGRKYILHHGTILYRFELELVSCYLKMPRQMPDYRCLRSHKDFITNITFDIPRFKAALAHMLDG